MRNAFWPVLVLCGIFQASSVVTGAPAGGGMKGLGGMGAARGGDAGKGGDKEEDGKKKDEPPKWETKRYKGYFICACSQMAVAGPAGKDFEKGKHDACLAERLAVFFKATKEIQPPSEGKTESVEVDIDRMFIVAGVRTTADKMERISDTVMRKLISGNAVFEVRCELYEPGKEKTLPAVVFHQIGGDKDPVWKRKEKEKQKDAGQGMFGTR